MCQALMRYKAIIFFAPTYFISAACLASSVSIGYQSSDYGLGLSQADQDIELSGLNLFVSADINEKVSLSMEFSDLSNEQLIQQNLTAELTAQNWSVSTAYNWENSYASVKYTQIQQEEALMHSRSRTELESLDSDYVIYSFTFAYNWINENWQLGSSIGMHHSDWEEVGIYLVNLDDPVNVNIDENSNATFLSISADISHYISISNASDLILGGGITWNQLLDDEIKQNILLSRPNDSRTRPVNNDSSAITGTESYAQIHTYVAYFFMYNWQLDFSATIDFEAEQNNQFWSVSLGYSF